MKQKLLKYGFLAKDGTKLNPNIRHAIMRNPEFYTEIENTTSFLVNPTSQERVYCILYNITETPICVACGKVIKFKLGYAKCCSLKCNIVYEKNTLDITTGKTLYQLRKEKVILSNKKIGIDGLSGYERGSRKGADIRATQLVDGKTGQEIATNKALSTKALIGLDGKTGHQRSNEKMVKTSRKLGSFERAKYKRKNTMLTTFIDGKSIEQIRHENAALSRFTNIIDTKIKLLSADYDIVDRAEYFETRTSSWKCKKCSDIIANHSFYNGQNPRCPRCFPPVQSQPQEDIFNLLSQYATVIRNTRSVLKGLELDLYIPDNKLAIEFNGVYWHSDKFLDANYHLNKTLECEKLGITLIHVFEDEWVNKRDIVKSRLLHILGVTSTKLYARKCEIIELLTSEKDIFLDDNHIQGHDISKLKYGLKYENELVAVMTFGKPRFNKNYEWELIRYASRKDTSVIGGAAKLMSHFIKQIKPKSIISYADRRWSSGKLYYKLKFALLNKTLPGYTYLVKGRRENRMKYQKHNLKKLLPNFSVSLSESENMRDAGFYRIYDCGNLVFTWQSETQ